MNLDATAVVEIQAMAQTPVQSLTTGLNIGPGCTSLRLTKPILEGSWLLADNLISEDMH